jgi:hypothetical protein
LRFAAFEQHLDDFAHTVADTLRVGYERNTADVDAAVAALVKYNEEAEPAPKGERRVQKHPLEAVVMLGTHRPAANFIQKIRAVPALANTLFFNVSLVGSESAADELASISRWLSSNVYVTQVVLL